MGKEPKLSYDGKGINDKTKEYAPRIATFTSPEMAEEYGPLFENSLAMVDILKKVLHARSCNAPYGQTEKYPTVLELKELLSKVEKK